MIKQTSLVWDTTFTTWETTGEVFNTTANTFENVAFDRVLDNLALLLSNEFYAPVFYDEHKGNQSFLLQLLEDTLIDVFPAMQTRQYSVSIEHRLLNSGRYEKNQVKQMSETNERVKRLIRNNITLSNGWHHGRIVSNTIERNEELLTNVMQFQCRTIEMSSI